jgi:general L-amino acid transport system substrate-binding protein
LRLLRCAIYTRKSSERGLEQEFNSLDNQREATEAFIRSQAHEGWRNNMKFEPVTFATNNEATEAYESGRCDAFTTDQSGLYSERLRFKDPSAHVVLPETISKEPLGYFVRHGDDQWFDIITWIHYAQLTAEELGVTQANVDEMREKSDNPDVRRLLGKEGSFGQALGLDNDWAFRIIKAVGNYGESFERHLGQQSPLKIARGQNALWSDGGLQYAPPIR